ncbi:MAG: SH3 domain-containing protein [Myxococcaceae bacterium]|nr:SH3 domain-containing protein [Myxococcaceae bacterium]
MHARGRWLVATLVLFATGTALAVKPGGILYVKARNTRLMASASPTADVVAILQPGQQVTWRGADPKNKQWHRVEVRGRKGVVFQSNLATKPPNMELVAEDGTRKVDPVAFANSGAAVKGLSDGAIQYGRKKGQKTLSYSQAVDQILALEAEAKKIKPKDISAHASRSQLFPVVGAQETTSRGVK